MKKDDCIRALKRAEYSEVKNKTRSLFCLLTDVETDSETVGKETFDKLKKENNDLIKELKVVNSDKKKLYSIVHDEKRKIPDEIMDLVYYNFKNEIISELKNKKIAENDEAKTCIYRITNESKDPVIKFFLYKDYKVYSSRYNVETDDLASGVYRKLWGWGKCSKEFLYCKACWNNIPMQSCTMNLFRDVLRLSEIAWIKNKGISYDMMRECYEEKAQTQDTDMINNLRECAHLHKSIGNFTLKPIKFNNLHNKCCLWDKKLEDIIKADEDFKPMYNEYVDTFYQHGFSQHNNKKGEVISLELLAKKIRERGAIMVLELVKKSLLF